MPSPHYLFGWPYQAADAISDKDLATHLGHMGRDETTDLLNFTKDGTVYTLRVVGTVAVEDAEPYFEWVNDIGDPVGDIFDEIPKDPAEIIKCLVRIL